MVEKLWKMKGQGRVGWPVKYKSVQNRKLQSEIQNLRVYENSGRKTDELDLPIDSSIGQQ